MKKELESGTTLIVDRYAYSGVAFTASKPVSNFSLYCIFLLLWLISLLVHMSIVKINFPINIIGYYRVLPLNGASSLMWV